MKTRDDFSDEEYEGCGLQTLWTGRFNDKLFYHNPGINYINEGKGIYFKIEVLKLIALDEYSFDMIKKLVRPSWFINNVELYDAETRKVIPSQKYIQPYIRDKKGILVKNLRAEILNGNWCRAVWLKKKADAGDKHAMKELEKLLKHVRFEIE